MQRDTLNNRTRLTVTMTAMALALPLAGVAVADPGNGKGDERPQTAPGQDKKAENAAPQSSHSTSGNGYGAGKSEKPAKADRPAKKAMKAKPAKPAKPARPAATNPHAKAGKTTICHATGSDSNPYVAITISNNALKAHARHQDGEDIIPAPAAGCPKGEDKPAAATDAAKRDHGQKKVTICHATGSETNPYVKITVAEPALKGHARHHDGADIIPAPEGECPAPAPAATVAALGAPATVAALRAAAAILPPALVAAGGEASLPEGGVLGEFASGGGEPAAAVAGRTVRRQSGADTGANASGSLPFTGLDAWVLVVLGLGAVLAGVAMRRAATRRPTV